MKRYPNTPTAAERKRQIVAKLQAAAAAFILTAVFLLIAAALA